ncbi:hypothetical protein HK104_009005 [Borealophlyctis nickersoniae]|nr:hypothetical protein HK104_009005 [Borealophlyctis nickersoniae]
MTQPTVDQSNTAMDIETAVATITAAAGGNVGSKDVVSSLTTLNVALEGRNAAQVLAFTEQHPLSPEQLAMLMPALEDEHSVNLVCRVLEKLLVPLNYQAVQERFQPLLLAGFDDPNASVRKLVLSAVSKAAQSEDAVLLLVASDVFPALLECLSFADIEVGEITARILVEVAKYHTGFQALFGDTSVSILSQLTGGDDVVKFRVYDLVARVSSTSDEALGLAQRSGLLQLMIEDLESDDILTALNIIELFSKLIETDVGLSFLETAGVLPQLVSVLQEEAVDDVSAVLYRCGVIKFFGRLAVHQPEALKSAQGKYNIFGLLDRQLESPSRELKEAALVAIGNIGSTCTGLRSLDAQNALLASFTDTYRSSAGPTKIIAMQSLSYLLGVSEAPDNEISSITNRIYTGLGGSSSRKGNVIIAVN